MLRSNHPVHAQQMLWPERRLCPEENLEIPGTTGKRSGVKPFVDRLGVLVITCRQAELALADL